MHVVLMTNNENFIEMNISLKFVTRAPPANKAQLVHLLARCPTNKLLPEPMLE